MLKSLLSARPLKKVQMQGGAPGTHPPDGCRREAYSGRTSQHRTQPSVGYPARQRRRWAVFSGLLGAADPLALQDVDRIASAGLGGVRLPLHHAIGKEII